MNPIDRSAKKKGRKISSRYAHWQRTRAPRAKHGNFV